MVALTLEAKVRARAKHRCEYCQLPEQYVVRRFQMDHVLASKHIADDSFENLALACHRCNSYKGPNVAGLHPVTRRIVRLYNPRKDTWSEHFVWQGATIQGLTDIGAVTVAVLLMNERRALNLRGALMNLNLFFADNF